MPLGQQGIPTIAGLGFTIKYLYTILAETIMDALIINELIVNTKIGVHAWEQAINQKLEIDIHIPCDFSSCEDDISQTLDYDALCTRVIQWVESQSFQLIETVANKVAQLIQQEFKVKELRITVSKPGAVKQAKRVSVVVHRL